MRAVRTELSMVNTTSLAVSTNWPTSARLVQPAGTTRGRSPAARGMNWAVMYGIRARRTLVCGMMASS
ncbi:hypothetical protein D3C71_1839320 [compost metagenome]